MTQLPFSASPVVSPTTGEVLPGFTVGTRKRDPFGRARERPGQAEWDFNKELRNKIAWVIGTAYGIPYSTGRSEAQVYALLIQCAIVRDHGYPPLH